MLTLVLASGFGTRLYPLTKNRAKALLEYKGKPLLTHIVDRVPENMRLLVTTNRKFEAEFRHWYGGVAREVEICVEEVWSEEQAKGAVGSLNWWINHKAINEDLLVIAGDNYFEFSLAEFVAAYDGTTFLVAVKEIGDKDKARQFGVVSLDEHQRVTEFEEKPTEPRSSFVATGIYLIPPRILPLLNDYCRLGKKDNLGNFLVYVLQRDEIKAHTFWEPWFDIASEIRIDRREEGCGSG